MSSEILSQNDIDLLLGGAGGGIPEARERPVQTREVQLYDFRRPHRVSKDRLRALQGMYERFAKSIEGWIVGRVRDSVELTLQSVEPLSMADFTLSLPTPCCAFLVEVGDSGGERGVIDFGHDFACFLVDRMLGGRGEPEILKRGFTPIERMVIRTVAERTCVALQEVWSEYLRLELTLSGYESVPEILQSAGGDSPVLIASIEARAGSVSSLMSVCIPFPVLDTFFADSGRPRRIMSTASADERTATREIAEGSLRSARGHIVARLPDFQLPLRNVADLKPGAVIATGIPQGAEVLVSLNGQLRYTARAARVGSRLAVQVLDPISLDAPAQKGVPGGTVVTPEP